jgi:hypothetical protein
MYKIVNHQNAYFESANDSTLCYKVVVYLGVICLGATIAKEDLAQFHRCE